MMSLIKDAERIGDYSKNIFDLAIMLDGDAKEMKYIERLSSVQRKISERFPLLQRAFLDSNEEAANSVLMEYEAIKGECKGLLLDLFDDKLPLREAVTTTILIRSFKRINSHMSNIATGMVYPMDKIDFVRPRDGLLD